MLMWFRYSAAYLRDVDGFYSRLSQRCDFIFRSIAEAWRLIEEANGPVIEKVFFCLNWMGACNLRLWALQALCQLQKRCHH